MEMRVNIYNEEFTMEVKSVTTTAKTGEVYHGIRFILKSTPDLHNMPDDDDRSAVTFWSADPGDLRELFSKARTVAERVGPWV